MEKVLTPDVNLAKNRGKHLSDRIIEFALSIGRVLIILTEAIALGAFLFRFGLDRQLVDLHDRINQEQAILLLLKNNEQTYRNLQDRLVLSDTVSTIDSTTAQIVTTVAGMIPSDMNLTLLSFNTTNMKIDGTISSLVSLSSLINKLQSNAAIDRVSLDKVENRSSQGIISISLTVYLKPSKITL